ncbi:hypothetical protein ACIQMY_22850 [Streptomyces sp. NPDC091368]|uniref:hypothetical protein n=1 Tax=Streptomyces sp. NPDC091368 TaxID=3365993 RepID=UPI003827B4B1
MHPDESIQDADGTAWGAALERLLDDVYTFAMTGPRLHDDWARDVLAVMGRSVTDPRRRQTLDWHGDEKERGEVLPSHPFLPLTPEQVCAWTYPITAEAAADLLASLSQEWFFEARPVRERTDRDDVLADARTVLGRFGDDASFRTSSHLAWNSDAPDFLTGELTGGPAFSEHMIDLGLIAVSADEVGVFWSFNAN